MGKTVSIDLGDELGAFVEAQVAAGGYDSPDEVLRAGLRLMEAQLSALQAALVEGEQSGPSQPFDFEEFILRKRAAKG